MPIHFANIVCFEINEVYFPVNRLLPPLGITPFKKAIKPGIPDEAAAGS